jgi:multicomponent Na+:H+ antiporter subunit F
MRELLLTGMQWFLLVCMGVCIIRLILGPSSADRLVALNILSGVTLGFLVIIALVRERTLFLDVALVYDIFGFLGFLAIARFLKKSDTKKESSHDDS